MNKNYKENLKNRQKDARGNIKDTKKFDPSKKRLDIKEFVVKYDSTLLEYLIAELKFSRNNAKNLLSHRLISIEGAPVTQFDFKLFKGDNLIISKKPIRSKKRSNMPIVFENDEIIVINKPAGLLSIASDKEKSSTAYRMVMDYLQSKDKHARIFVVHRLDKETSGLLMFAKNEKLRDALQDNWNDLVTQRGYYAVVEGQMEKPHDKVINYLKMNAANLMYVVKSKNGSQKCITEYQVVKENKKHSLLDVHLFTGRKNQIRVTLGDLGHYVLGDDKYGEPENPIGRLCLHSYQLEFKHPFTGKVMKFSADMPKEFADLVK